MSDDRNDKTWVLPEPNKRGIGAWIGLLFATFASNAGTGYGIYSVFSYRLAAVEREIAHIETNKESVWNNKGEINLLKNRLDECKETTTETKKRVDRLEWKVQRESRGN